MKEYKFYCPCLNTVFNKIIQWSAKFCLHLSRLNQDTELVILSDLYKTYAMILLNYRLLQLKQDKRDCLIMFMINLRKKF